MYDKQQVRGSRRHGVVDVKMTNTIPPDRSAIFDAPSAEPSSAYDLTADLSWGIVLKTYTTTTPTPKKNRNQHQIGWWGLFSESHWIRQKKKTSRGTKIETPEEEF